MERYFKRFIDSGFDTDCFGTYERVGFSAAFLVIVNEQIRNAPWRITSASAAGRKMIYATG